MPRGNGIVVQTDPKGSFRYGKLSGTPLPGQIVTVKPGTTVDDNGNFTYEPAGFSAGQMSADGDRITVAVLCEDNLQGKITSDAYADGALALLYFPLPGDELNILFQNQAGTADDVVAGTTKLIIDDGTGKILPTTGSPKCEPFLALESVTDPTADQLIWVQFTGY